MPTRKKKPTKRRPAPRHIPDPPAPSASRSFETFTKCNGCGEGSIDVQKFPIHHRPGCTWAYITQPNVLPAPHEVPGKHPSNVLTLRHLIAKTINSVSAENGSDTPDFILARFLTDCLDAFDHATRHRTEWYSSKGMRSSEFAEPPNTGRPFSEDVLPSHPPGSRQEVQFNITPEQMGTFGAGWRQRLAGNAALPPNMDPRRVEALKRLAIVYADNVELGRSIMEINGSEGFRP